MLHKLQSVCRYAIQMIASICVIFVIGTILFIELDRENRLVDFTGKIFISDYVNNLFCALLIIVFVIVWNKMKWGQKDTFKTDYWKLILAVVSLVLLIIQIGFVYHIYFYAGADSEFLRIGAEYFVNGIFHPMYNVDYYQDAPNNIMAYVIYIFAYYASKLLGWGDGHILLIGVNVILANLAVVVSALTAYKLTENKKVMWMVYILSTVLFGFTPWLSIPYTNMLSILSPILTIYIYISIKDKKLPNILKWFAILIVPFLMYGMKPLNIIIGIAILISELLNFEFSKKNITKMISFLVAIVLVLGTVQVVQGAMQEFIRYEKAEDEELAMTWVLFLGSDNETYGMWAYDNFMYASQYETKSARDEALIKAALDNISDMGPVGYVKHWMNKTNIFYNDSHFGWGNTAFAVVKLSEEKDVVSHVIREFFFPPENFGFFGNISGYGTYFKYYSILKQFAWLFTLSFLAIGICRPSKDKKVLILKLTWVGVFLFAMLFETQARLLLCYLPVFALMAGVGASDYRRKEELE